MAQKQGEGVIRDGRSEVRRTAGEARDANSTRGETQRRRITVRLFPL
ncbi:hypothetical protein Slin15195_G130750 [Septoria linicola]|uniref:Uncharacterized protein n=1 Tax=Septoria linicola TaxID=215465 RepID=A0A9Q9BBA0_9PEZI|nr:hypothetical protein Slin15195_G130750 [Septoria linicola]